MTWLLLLLAIVGFPLGYVLGARHAGRWLVRDLRERFGKEDENGKGDD
jgi:hypothetical protein